MQLRAALVATTCLLALAGCGPSDRAEEPVARAGAVPEVVVPEAPDGHRMVEIDSGLAFAIPDEWSEVTAERLNAADPRFDAVLEAMGVTAEQFQALLAQVDAFYAAPTATRGFVPNLNVLAEDVSLPSEAGMRAQYRAIGATDVEVEDAESRLGEAVVTAFTLDLGQPSLVYGGAVALEYDGGHTVITLSASTPTAMRALRDVVLETLHETDPRRSTTRSGT